ncbi:glycosyltransferase [Candidatus Saccharibacteria bacterium]|nr:glycosyltransferase [Candidatus Saccharibacteria bacterium]
MKIAIVCDWLTNVGGAERVLLAIHEMYPDAPIYTSKYNKKGIGWFKDADVRTGWLQIFPTGLRRFLGPLRQRYFRKLDLSEYDLVISVTGAEAKAVKAKKHICYCHVPTQYYWQMYDEYIRNPGFGIFDPLARLGLRLFIKPQRKKDYAAAQDPDEFVTISEYAAEQIKKYYGRESTIIHPPVNVKKFSTASKGFSTGKTGVGFITTSRQVTWKRLDLCVEACLEIGSHLTIIGEGPEHKKLVELAAGSPLISFYPRMDQDELKTYLANADAYLFPSLEPFGIAPVEALAAGCPVIAYGKGGALDYVKPNENGIFFESQTPESLAYAIKKFKDLKSENPKAFNYKKIQKSAEKFDERFFKEKLKRFIDEKIK